MSPRFLYLTCANLDEARQIGRALVEARLAACANILPTMQSIYHWDGAVVSDEEVVLILKSRAGHMEALVDQVKALHSYEVPCVVSLPILEGNSDYLQWIQTETERND